MNNKSEIPNKKIVKINSLLAHLVPNRQPVPQVELAPAAANYHLFKGVHK